MSNSPLVNAVQDRLRSAGYSDLSTPFRVAGVEFAFTGAMHGRDGRALDLVLLIDTTTGEFGDRDGDRVRQRVEALSRALDVTGSRYVVTAIFAGAVLAEGGEALAETCRVLHVEDISLDDNGKLLDDVAVRRLDDRIRVLLPLTLPLAGRDAQNGTGTAMDQLIRLLPPDTNPSLVDALINASDDGEQAVSDALAAEINLTFQVEPEEEQS
jgi:hypothetical protein